MTGPRRAARRKVRPGSARTFWEKASRFRHAADAQFETGLWDPAVSNAVTACINLSDAITTHFRGEHSRSGDHTDALDNLSDAAPAAGDWVLDVAGHLGSLLQMKGAAQYEAVLLTKAEAERAVLHMDRAFGHAERQLRTILGV